MGLALPFQVPVERFAIRQNLFTQQDTAAIAELSRPDAKLMSAVDLSQRLHARKQRFAAPDAGAFFWLKSVEGMPSESANASLCQIRRAFCKGVGLSAV